MAKTILLVDDEQDILDLLEFNLKTEGYRILTARDGEKALELAERFHPDLIILDIMLPEKDGWTVLRELRSNGLTQNIPVIFLTAKNSEIDEVVGLELGADDYIVKPISLRKLIARVKTVLRKSKEGRSENRSAIMRFNGLEINPDHFSVRVDGQEIKLTKKEFQILEYLARRAGRVVTREALLDHIWGYDVIVTDRTIDVHIRKIREKLGEKYASMIETFKGVGYRLKNDPS
ncbi:MAG: response regulator transcription factor [candidate division KSB1 bacterium]|nr:response regulator transcription factor [candidate division KSB1 bacterium]